jgi:hypothetical protein
MSADLESNKDRLAVIAETVCRGLTKLKMNGFDDFTPFAFEVEAGADFCLNSVVCWRDLAAQFSEEFRDLFGINLDCSHLLQIDELELLQESTDLLKLIRNVHIGGHARFHVGDCICTHVPREVINLLSLVLDQVDTNQCLSASLEFEAAPSIDAVARSMEVLLSI